jgi:hypothetical protein
MNLREVTACQDVNRQQHLADRVVRHLLKLSAYVVEFPFQLHALSRPISALCFVTKHLAVLTWPEDSR